MPLSLGPGHAAALDALQPSPYWGSERIWETRVNNHNSMFGRDGRLWLAATVRGADNPAFCKAGSDHPSAKAFPMDRAVRHLAVFDPKTKKYTFVDTCYSTHHPQFGYDANDTLWTSGGGPVVGWLNTKMFDQTGDAAKSQGWTALVLDTNGNGKRDAYAEPNQPADPAKDTRINSPFYAVMPSPVDGSIWGIDARVSRARSCACRPGRIRRRPRWPRSTPCRCPASARAAATSTARAWSGCRSAAATSAASIAASARGRSTGRRPPAITVPKAGRSTSIPGPGFQGIGDNSAESSYYSWVDQHNTFGLGNDVPMSTGNLNDGIIAYANGRMVVLRVPYPIGFYAKGFDGRIDDPKAGWKGRGLWAANGDRTPWLIEGGKGTKPLAAHFQLRPDPLAK